MKPTIALISLLFPICVAAKDIPGDSIILKTADHHPMQYFLSLPDNWSKEKKWPVVVIIESADKEYRENALRFVRARKNMPFILIAPYNVNNSRQGRRDPKVFPYSADTWDLIERTGDCQFNYDGISAIVSEVQQKYNGENKFFITGFEAGAHTVWQFVFQHPQMLNAAAPVAGNYNQNSCMTEALFSKDSSRIHLPVREFTGELDTPYGVKGPVYYQWQNAKAAAESHGYRNISETVIAKKAHVPLPGEVLDWFMQLLKK